MEYDDVGMIFIFFLTLDNELIQLYFLNIIQFYIEVSPPQKKMDYKYMIDFFLEIHHILHRHAFLIYAHRLLLKVDPNTLVIMIYIRDL